MSRRYNIIFSRKPILDVLAVWLVLLLATIILIVSVEIPREKEDFIPATDDSELELEWLDPIIVALGEAYRGPWHMNESDFRYLDDPTVAFTLDEGIAVAWVDQERQDIFLQIYEFSGESRFPEPVNVSNSPGIFSWFPRIAVSPDNPEEIYILWQEIVFKPGGTHGGEIFFARSTDEGKTFQQPINLSNTLAGDGKGRLTLNRWDNGSLAIAVEPAGIILTAWTEYEGTLLFSRSTDRGKSFSKPLHITGSFKRPARAPVLAVSPRSNIYLAWTFGEDPTADIHFTRSVNGGRTFEEPQVAYVTDGHSDAPKLAVDGEGTLHLVFAESSNGPFQNYNILYSRLNNGAFEEPRRITGLQGQEFANFHFPFLAFAQESSLFVGWHLFPDYRFADRSYFPKGFGLAFSKDRGENFSLPEIVPNSINPDFGFIGSQQGLLMERFAADNKGNLVIVNSTFRPNEQSRIWLYRAIIKEK